jgi:hypothetical protein
VWVWGGGYGGDGGYVSARGVHEPGQRCECSAPSSGALFWGKSSAWASARPQMLRGLVSAADAERFS